MRYLCVNNEGGEELYPSDPVLRAKIDMVMDWRQTGMYTCIPAIAYIVFGIPQKDEDAKESFAKLMDEHFPILMDEYLKDTQFCYSDKVTIADLSIAPVLTFLKCRPKFWEKVPEKVKDYYTRVLESCKFVVVWFSIELCSLYDIGCFLCWHCLSYVYLVPDTKENFDMLDGMCTGYDGEGKDCEP